MPHENKYAPVERTKTLLTEANEQITQAKNAEETDVSGCLDCAADKLACAKSAIEALGYPKLMSIIVECEGKIARCRTSAAANGTSQPLPQSP